MSLTTKIYNICLNCSSHNNPEDNICKNCSSILTPNFKISYEQTPAIYLFLLLTVLLAILYFIISLINKRKIPENKKTSQQYISEKDQEKIAAFKILNLPMDSSAETIRNRWRDLLKKYHPDKNHFSNSRTRLKNERKTAEINKAYSYLTKLKNKQV